MDSIRVGIVGAGMIAHFHAKALAEINEVRLVGIFTRSRSKGRDFAQAYSCEAFSSLDGLLGAVDMILVATPSGSHMEVTIAAAERGVHVLCEKPLEISVARIRSMIDICKKNNVLLGGIFNRRFNSAVEHLKRAVDSKRFGQLAICDAQIKWYRTQQYYDSGGWRGTWSLDGGGALMNQSIHTIDLLQYIVGPVKRLCATIKTLTHHNIEVEDNAVAMLEFMNGAIGTIQASTSCWSIDGHAAQINLSGEKGSVFLKDDKFGVWEFKESHEEDNYVRNHLMSSEDLGLGANDPSAINYDGHISNTQNFVAALRGTEQLQVDGYEAMKSVNIIRSIYESAQNGGKWITL